MKKKRQIISLVLFCVTILVGILSNKVFKATSIENRNVAVFSNIIVCVFVFAVIFLILLVYYFIRYDLKAIFTFLKYWEIKDIKRFRKQLIFISVIIVVLLVGFGGYYNNKAKIANLNTKTVLLHTSFNKLDEKERDKYLCVQANKYIRGTLKSPSTAKFSDPNMPHEENVITGETLNSYVVIGYVDAQNSFGAMIRSNFSVTIQIKNNQYNKDTNGYSYSVISYTFNDNQD